MPAPVVADVVHRPPPRPALPCRIAPFSARGYANYTLGDATQQSLREIWNGDAYRDFRAGLLGDVPPKPCQGCGLRWSL